MTFINKWITYIIWIKKYKKKCIYTYIFTQHSMAGIVHLLFGHQKALAQISPKVRTCYRIP